MRLLAMLLLEAIVAVAGVVAFVSLIDGRPWWAMTFGACSVVAYIAADRTRAT